MERVLRFIHIPHSSFHFYHLLFHSAHSPFTTPNNSRHVFLGSNVEIAKDVLDVLHQIMMNVVVS